MSSKARTPKKASANSVWDGEGLSQEDFMMKDECILCDENDHVIGHANKKDAHIFSDEQPRGLLHRAFSVFLFDMDGRLMLQQRAASKITFPDVWTNTCCSHPLYGYEPNEVDSDEAIASGQVAGVKAAAVRKLKQELGISSKKVNIKAFKFLTRLHYWAADVVTHGTDSPWGEHEVDYILFAQANVRCKPNPEEVQDIKYVTLPELQDMMLPSSGLLWSPWFRIIVENFLVHWWKDLATTLETDKFVDVTSIHHFDPTAEHMGGGGHAGEWLGQAASPYTASGKKIATPKKAIKAEPAGVNAKAQSASAPASEAADKGLKQGAYGKVKIHKHSKLEQISHFGEIVAALKVLYGNALDNKLNVTDENVKFCDDILVKVSRSFAAVIKQLPEGLCLDILVFYLVLRALDTIEDDMEVFKGRNDIKIEKLKNFYKVLGDETWSLEGVGEADEALLLEQYYRCNIVFNRLSKDSQAVIRDITKRMGEGMALYVEKDLGQGTVKISDYDLYCHYVAGLVGEGLSRLFTCTGYEDESVGAVAKTLANTMGLFLQKTNILRDYLEDYVDGRAFWPQEVWKNYAPSGDLGELAKPESRDRAVHCLNHLVTNALECVPECLQYMDLLHTEEVYRFCSIPQVMAIATLDELYGNDKVFTGVVKIRKGMACQLILDSSTVTGTYKWFYNCATNIQNRVDPSDPSAAKTIEICKKIRKLTEAKAQYGFMLWYLSWFNTFATIALGLSSYRMIKSYQAGNFLIAPTIGQEDVAALGIFVLSFMIMLAHAMVLNGAPTMKKDKNV
jgi:farnesyl-diphosphate farnesyltransferase